MKKTKESNVSTLLRIMTNFVQIITTAASYKLGYPDFLVDFLRPTTFIGESSEQLVSIDCFIADSVDTSSTFPSTFFVKALVTLFVPVIAIVFVALYWGMLGSCLPKIRKNFNTNLIFSTVVVLYLLHPTISLICFSLFNCFEVEPGQKYLLRDLEIKCWDNKHTLFAYALGLPMLLLWVLGLPLIAIWVLCSNRHQL